MQIEIGQKLHVNHQSDRTDYFYFVKFFGNSVDPQVPEEILDFGWFKIEDADRLNLFFGFEAALAAQTK